MYGAAGRRRSGPLNRLLPYGTLLAPLSGMLGKIIGSGQLGKLASFVSPTFFDVMPAGALWSRARRLYALTHDREAHERAVKERAAQLKSVMPDVQLAGPRDKVDSGPRDGAGRDANWRANAVVELYFRQLFLPGPTLLDLRSVAFTQGAAGLLWKPAPWIAEWSSDFIEPLRELYRGFYTHDDEQFRRGLAALSLSHSEDLFRAQFGAEQAHVVFRTQEFIDIFHQVFTRCKSNGTKLHPDFLPLGIYLAALYDHEQDLGVPVDVVQAFSRLTSGDALNRDRQGTTHA